MGPGDNGPTSRTVGLVKNMSSLWDTLRCGKRMDRLRGLGVSDSRHTETRVGYEYRKVRERDGDLLHLTRNACPAKPLQAMEPTSTGVEGHHFCNKTYNAFIEHGRKIRIQLSALLHITAGDRVS